jgi:hypothetical protein
MEMGWCLVELKVRLTVYMEGSKIVGVLLGIVDQLPRCVIVPSDLCRSSCVRGEAWASEGRLMLSG